MYLLLGLLRFSILFPLQSGSIPISNETIFIFRCRLVGLKRKEILDINMLFKMCTVNFQYFLLNFHRCDLQPFGGGLFLTVDTMRDPAGGQAPHIHQPTITK